jgi:hypothetical protein
MIDLFGANIGNREWEMGIVRIESGEWEIGNGK